MLFNDIETDRLILKCIAREDREFMLSQFSDEKVTKYLYDAEPMKCIEDADELIDFYTVPEPRIQHRWIIIRKADGIKIGTCGFHRWNTNENTVEIGYDMKADYWGNGYMQEAMKKIINFAKNDMSIKKINAVISVDNDKSIHLAKKLGFVVSGTSYEIFRNEKFLHNIYTLYINNTNSSN